ncbi:MAG: hypothetical protein M1570_12745 [Chloroflexi bacterium]|nr:hypothetical protein [Chloroflexota bacterium]
MSNWKSLLHGDATEWLLEKSDPSVRYFALRWLCDQPEKSAEVVRARQGIARSTPVRKIIDSQRPEGYWGSDRRPHHGTSGPLMLLLWLGAPGDTAIRKAMDYRIHGCLLSSGAYAVEWKERKILLPCHGVEMLTLMLRYGYAGDPRTRRLLDWLLSVQETDGVWPCPWKRDHFPCMWATADVLRAFRDLPPRWVTARVKQARQRAVELFLNSNLCQYHKRKVDPRWLQFGFPLAFTSDILDVLESIAQYVSRTDERIKGPLEMILAKQDERGRWACEKHPHGSSGGKWIEQYGVLEELGAPSKWVTLHALRTLKLLYAGA